MKKIYTIGAAVVLLLMLIFPIKALGILGDGYINCPEAEFQVIPEGLVQPGQEFTIQAMTEHFSAEEADRTNMFYVWCLDNNLINTINAGSDDKFVENTAREGFHLENEYGAIKSNDLAACRGFELHDEGDLVSVYSADNSTFLEAIGNSDEIDIPPAEGWLLKRRPVVDSDHDGLDDNWEIKYFSGRLIEETIEVPIVTGGWDEYITLLQEVYEDEDNWTCGDVEIEYEEEGEEIATLEISEYMPTATDEESEAELLGLVTPEGVQIHYESIEEFLPEVCDDEIDNNLNGLTDCDDIDDCADASECIISEEEEEEEEELTEEERLAEISEEVARESMVTQLSEMIANPIVIPDPDDDEWEWPYTDGAWGGTEDHDPAPLFAPRLGIGWLGRPWMIGIPYPQNAATDEMTPLGLKNPPYFYSEEYLSSLGFFTAFPITSQLEQGISENNLTEYFRGTDPLNSDTDSDGVLDAEDYLGRMQDNINLRTQKENGEEYTVDLTVFGVTESFRNNEVEQNLKYDTARYPLLMDKCSCDPQLSATPEDEDKITVGTGLALKIGWGYSPAPPVAKEGESVVVNVKTSRLTDLASLDLKYKWYLDSEGATPWNEDELEEDKSGYNKDSFQFEPTKKACEEHIVGLELTEEDTGSVTFQEMPIPMGFDSNLTSTVIGNVDLDNDLIKDFNESSGANLTDYNFNDIGDNGFILNNDYFKDSINEINESGFGMGFRKGDLIEVRLNNIEDGYEDACESKYGNYENAKENFYFNWWYTRRKQKVFSGKGDDFSIAYFIVKDNARGTDNDGQEADSLINTGSEFVSVEMLDEEGNVLAKNKENLRVIAPYIDFIVEGAEVGTSREDTGVPTYYAQRGDEIKITSALNYFRPSKGYDQVWKRNGETKSELRGSPDMVSSTYTFRAGMDINGNELENNKEVIALEVNSEVSSEKEEATETADETITISLERPPAGGIDTAIGGAINKFIPHHYKNVFGLFMTFGLAGAILVFVLGFMKKTSGKK